jgi:multidrug efflux pump subunit AcrB
MDRAIAWFARNGVAANLLMVFILVAGVITALRVKTEVFPEFSLDLVTISVEYLGASPEEVEEGVNIRIEEEIQGLDGVKEITSVASEGIGVVTVELELGANVGKVLDDIKSRVDAIDTFPVETEKPVYTEITNRQQVIDIAIFGDADEKTLRHLAEQIRDELTATDGISVVSLASARPYEISIEVSEQAMRRHGITFDDVARAVRRSSLDLPAGSVKTEGGEILLRTKGQAYVGEEFERLVLLTRTDGTQLLLGDVAEVRDAFADTDQTARFDGKPAVLVQVFRTGDQSPLDIVAKVGALVEEAQVRMPEGVYIVTWRDAAKILKDRMSVLTRNGSQGFALVILVLALFLRFRLALWVSVGLIISFLGAIWLMPVFDVSVNLISLFAFILVLGIVVDDAIVVGENIHRQQHRLGDGMRGSTLGAQEVAIPVTFAVLTTVAAFFPLLAVQGTIGKIMRVIPLIVIPTLLFSLIESLFILPGHLSHYHHHKKEPRFWPSRMWKRYQGKFADRVEWFIKRVYKPSLEIGLEWRYATVAVGIATLLITAGLAVGGHVRFVFFPAVEADYVAAALTMPQGTPAEVTREAVAQLEAAARQVEADVEKDNGPVFRHLLAAVGEQPYKESQQANAGGARGVVGGGHLGEVTIELEPAENRSIGSEELAQRWREATGPIADAEELTFSSSIFDPGEDINVQFTGNDIDQLIRAADELKEILAGYAGVYEIAHSFREGKKEIKLDIEPAAEIYGLRLDDVARQVRQAFYGEEAQRIQRGRDDIKVMVRYPEDERRSVGDLENMRIRTPDGLEVPFSEVATADAGRGYASIKRVNRRRAVNVTAQVDANQSNAGEIIADLGSEILPELASRYPGMFYGFEGQEAERRDSMQGLQRGFIVALFAIFALLAIPLRSYVQPLLIMSAIPFGLVGAVWGHVIMGLNLTILSMFGLVALTGVVVNDSLVMVDFVNRKRQEGLDVEIAAREAGVARFRPILLTSLTTFFGLTPLILEKSMQARFLIPMAISLAFGVVFATFITLMLIPCGYVILDDILKLVRRTRSRKDTVPAREEAA